MTGGAEALERAAAGDAAAFESFPRAPRAALVRYIGTLSDDQERQADALQETLIAAWRGAGSFRCDASPRGWFFGIPRNRVRRQYRGSPVSRPSSLDEVAMQAGWGRDPAEALAERPERR